METQPIKVYDLKELIQMYKDGTLPEGEKVFRYKAAFNLEKWVHVDELKVQATFDAYYPNQKYVEKFSGIVNPEHHQIKKKEDNDKII